MNKIYKNCICLVLDESGSMYHLRDQVVRVVSKQVESLAKSSKELNQETRISVFTFNNTVKNLVFDVDVLRTPDINKLYNPTGSTALIDGTLDALADLKKIPQIHGDFGFLVIVASDGANNINNHKSEELKRTLGGLPDNFTIAFLAPNATAKHEAQRWGFPAQNIQIWEQTEKGLDDVGDTLVQATTNYMRARSTGVRSMKNLFTVDASNLTTSVVKNNLIELSPSQYEVLPVRQDKAEIKEYCTQWLGDYRAGSAYYQLTKKEIIQADKEIAVQNKLNGKFYIGREARNLLNLPNVEIRVQPENYGDFFIFIQSKSNNRHLVKGTQLLVLK